MTVRTRFAPSPTGYLHIGGVRTALFSWLYARKMGGQFILRIEDTDRERSTQESVDVILEGMEWFGLDHDEGPFYQTHRFDRYREVVQQLLDSGHAYYCDCSKQRLDAMREQQMTNKQKPRYDGCCRDKNLEHSDNTVIRFRNPDEGDVVIDDLVKGQVVISNRELDDLIIERSNDTPTYNLTVVVDDWDMKISHVIRGDDHLNNTPRQINILKALGADLPVYAHVPMILGADGKRLSKRHGAVSVLQYKELGYLPDALINYLVRLGWSHGDQEIFSREEMKELFEVSAINKSPSTFNPEKLLWLNQQYIMKLPVSDLVDAMSRVLGARGVSVEGGPKTEAVAELIRERCNTLEALADESIYFYQDFDEFDKKAAKKHLKVASGEVLNHLLQALTGLEEWKAVPIHEIIEKIAADLSVGMGKVGMPLRVATTGGSSSPSIDITLEVLGKDKTLDRIKKAIDYVRKREAAAA
jgi:glutamyl-tRNA synthetase